MFFAATILLSAVFETAYCLGNAAAVVPLMWTPAFCAAAACVFALTGRGEKPGFKNVSRMLGLKGCGVKYVFYGAALPLVYLLVPYAVYWCMKPENLLYRGVPLWIALKDCVPVAVVGIFGSMVTALGEELGWRGFLLPAMKERYGLKKALLFTGLFWCVWHYALLIFGGYMAQTALWYRLIAFTLCIFPVSVMAAVLTLESGSVWPAAFLHAAHNCYDQTVLDVITRGADKMYYVSETGVFTVVCCWCIALVMLTRYLKKTAAER